MRLFLTTRAVSNQVKDTSKMTQSSRTTKSTCTSYKRASREAYLLNHKLDQAILINALAMQENQIVYIACIDEVIEPWNSIHEHVHGPRLRKLRLISLGPMDRLQARKHFSRSSTHSVQQKAFPSPQD